MSAATLARALLSLSGVALTLYGAWYALTGGAA